MSDALNIKAPALEFENKYFCVPSIFLYISELLILFLFSCFLSLSKLTVPCNGRDDSSLRFKPFQRLFLERGFTLLCVNIMQGEESTGRGSSVAGRGSSVAGTGSLALALTSVNGKPPLS